MNKNKKEKIKSIIDSLEKIESKLNGESSISPTERKQVDSLVIMAKDALKSSKQLEENTDEGLPSESGKYNKMNYIDVLKQALQAENDAIEIGLELIELAPSSDTKKLIEITNDENDHSQIYQSIINRIEK